MLSAMAFIKQLNNKAKAESETGLSTIGNLSGGRFFNKDGTPNIQVKGYSFFARLNVYHSLLSMNFLQFISTIIFSFLIINLFFASIYLFIGLEHLGGMVATTKAEKFGEAYFFSAQTFTTVGYGRINPIGFWASFTAALEALVGLMSFALVTGLLYGRFARPKAFIKYSKNALIAPFKDQVAIMFRMVPYTKNYLMNVEVKITLAIKVLENGQRKNKFFNMDLDVAKATTMTTNWTLVHIINEESPFYQLSKEDIISSEAELLIFVQGFDESFANTVISRNSYTWQEFIYGARFLPMYHMDAKGTTTVLDLDKLNDYETVPLPMPFS
jgi:inward rectifier potassium channel